MVSGEGSTVTPLEETPWGVNLVDPTFRNLDPHSGVDMYLTLCLSLPALLGAPIGPYFGQKLPGKIPVRFAPGFVSTGLYERDLAVDRLGQEVFWTLMGNDHAVIVGSREAQGRWTPPEVLPFSGGPVVLDAEPALSPDGRRLYFLSTRPKDGSAPKPGWVNQDLWYVERELKGWSEPKNVGAPVNSDDEEFFPSFTAKGDLYFTRGKAGGKVSEVWRARWDGKAFRQAERLPDVINGAGPVFNAAISPDESMLVFCAAKRPGSLGGSDYWVSFRSPQDVWSPAVNLGDPYNGPGLQAIAPAFSTDGRFFFFSTNRRTLPKGEKRTWAGLQQERGEPGNGNSDVWWVHIDALEAFRTAK